MLRPLGLGNLVDSLTNRLSIRQRLVSSIALILGLFGLACLISIVALENVKDAQVFAESANTTLVQTAELADALSREESALRGYAISGAGRYLATMAKTRDTVATALGALETTNQGDALQRSRLSKIESLESRWHDNVATPIIQQVKKDRKLEKARQQLAGGASLSIFDPMRKILTRFRGDVRRQLTQRNAVLDYRTRRALWVLVGVLVFGLLAGIRTMRTVMRRVTRPLSELTDDTQRLAAGVRDVKVRYQARADEIGAVSRAIEEFRRIILEQDRQDWIRDQRARLTVLLHQCVTEKQVGERLLAELAPLLGAGYAALFTSAGPEEDEACFAVLSAYAYDGAASARFRPGQGLVGQVLASRTPIVLDALPSDYLPVQSGLGRARPTTLLVTPAIVGNRVVAVLELALFRHLRDTEQGLLDSLLPNVALALLSHARNQRTAELLEQSRAQSEALGRQSAELRASQQELKVQAKALQASNEKLREKQSAMAKQQVKLAELHEDVKRRAEALARASQYKSDFLANMSHELRTPLNSLLVLSRSLAENTAGNLDAEQVEAAGIIHESGSNLLALINDILDLSKIEAGKMQIRPETIATETFANRLERHFVHLAQRKQLHLSVRRAAGMPATIVTDAGKLEQIVRNLVGNAIKFTQRGGIRVELALPAANTVLKTDSLRRGNALAIHVSDDGIGIPADRLEQIFEAFEQVDAGTSRKYGGTGLGLSISRELARLLGGEIAVASTPGQGSRFSVFIRRDLDRLTDGGPVPVARAANAV